MVSCESIETEFGNSNIFFTRTAPQIALLDTIQTKDVASLSDSVINYVTVYRSGVVDHLDRIEVNIEIDNGAVQDLIDEANETDPLYRTDMMNRYVKAIAAEEGMFSIPSTVTIPEGERSVVVPLTMKRSLVIPYENAYLNYTLSDYNNSAITKDKMLVLGIRMTQTSSHQILESKSFCYFEIIKAFVLE